MGIGEIGRVNAGLYAGYAKPARVPAAGETLLPNAAASRETGDSLALGITEEARARLSDENNRYLHLFKQLEDAKKQGDSAAKAYEVLRKCMVIAMRIISGDKVPAEDYRFLAENEPEMYSKAIMLRRIKEDPEEYDRLSEDEDEEAASPETDGASETNMPQPPAAAAEPAREAEQDQ